MGADDRLRGPLFGAAYYDEYMPRDRDRIDDDMRMMTDIGITVIRIAESTWSTCEPQPGTFDFSSVDRVLDAARRHGIRVIVGTPTYAVPTWLARMHPEVIAVTPRGPGSYGARQIMDIVNPAYLHYAERVIRRLVSHVCGHPAVIGYQVDNETKYYDCVSMDMQTLFVTDLRARFHDDLDALNEAFGLDYWSNRINAWEDFPDLTGSINESLRGEFDRFRRGRVAAFLRWQADIVHEYARPDQFVTHNFDFEWRGYSFGVQPAVDHFKAAQAVDVVGVDIYHPTEDDLTGHEIAFCGDMARSMGAGRNYLVLETEAQGQNGWLPYPGQLRLQAYGHLASGADAVMYWHWHSIHHSFETYWKGLLSHDLQPNPTYREAGVIGREFADPELGPRVSHLRKENRVALMVSNASLSALEWFRIETGFPDGVGPAYNDVVRAMYDALLSLNVECDFVPDDASADVLARYDLLVVPAMYCASEETIARIRDYVGAGGHLVASMRSFVADETCGVWVDRAPHGLTDVFGMTYSQFTRPRDVSLSWTAGDGGNDGNAEDVGNGGAAENGGAAGSRDSRASSLIELLRPRDGTTGVLASYVHRVWGGYAAVTRHRYGDGSAEWIGTLPDGRSMIGIIRDAVAHAGIRVVDTPDGVSVRRGVNARGEDVTYLLNYSGEDVTVMSPTAGEVVVAPKVMSIDGTVDEKATAALSVHRGDRVRQGDALEIPSWNLVAVVGV